VELKKKVKSKKSEAERGDKRPSGEDREMKAGHHPRKKKNGAIHGKSPRGDAANAKKLSSKGGNSQETQSPSPYFPRPKEKSRAKRKKDTN